MVDWAALQGGLFSLHVLYREINTSLTEPIEAHSTDSVHCSLDSIDWLSLCPVLVLRYRPV